MTIKCIRIPRRGCKDPIFTMRETYGEIDDEESLKNKICCICIENRVRAKYESKITQEIRRDLILANITQI